MSVTPRLSLPFLSVGQAQKEAFHNEALQALDFMVSCAVEEPPRNDPPASPAMGACYLLSDAPTDLWSGKANCIAAFTNGGWRFVAPDEGMVAYVRSAGAWAAYRSGGWEIGQIRGAHLVLEGQQVVGPREPAIEAPSGGTIIDTQSRLAIEEILAAMRHHGLIET